MTDLGCYNFDLSGCIIYIRYSHSRFLFFFFSLKTEKRNREGVECLGDGVGWVSTVAFGWHVKFAPTVPSLSCY